MNNIKIKNNSDSQITLNCLQLDGRIIRILPRSFAYITEAQEKYVYYNSSVFQEGLITKLEEGEVEPPVKKTKAKVELDELLNKTVKEITDHVANVEDKKLLEELKEKASKEKKAKGFIEAIDNRIKQLG